MRYPVTLQPAGVIPRDPKLKLRMTPTPPTFEQAPAQVECPPVEIDPCCAAGTVVMLDEFGGSGNLSGRTSDSGATYTQVPDEGNSEAITYVIEDGILRRADFSEVGGDSLGEAFFYTDQQPTTSRYYMEVMIKFGDKLTMPDELPVYAFVQFHQDMAEPFSSHVAETLIGGISCQGLGNDATLLNPDDTPYTTSPGSWYKTRLFVDGVDLTLCINGEVVGTATLDAPPTLPLGFDTFNYSGDENFVIEYIKIADV